jgi:hypothetical protein
VTEGLSISLSAELARHVMPSISHIVCGGGVDINTPMWPSDALEMVKRAGFVEEAFCPSIDQLDDWGYGLLCACKGASAVPRVNIAQYELCYLDAGTRFIWERVLWVRTKPFKHENYVQHLTFNLVFYGRSECNCKGLSIT